MFSFVGHSQFFILLFFTAFSVLLTMFLKWAVQFFSALPWRQFVPLVVLFFLAVLLGITGFYIEHRQFGGLHDSAVQTEVALDFLVKGVNPYAVDYFGTSLQDIEYHDLPINPALYHFAYLPGVWLLSLPVYFSSHHLVGFYDQRLTQAWFLILLTGWLIWRYRQDAKLILLIPLLLLNFWFAAYFVHGLNDVLIVSLVALALEATLHGRYMLSAVLFGVALATKQTAWFAAPFLAEMVWLQCQNKALPNKNTKRTFGRWLVCVLATALIIIVPFLIWDSASFVADTLGYQSGQAIHSYPIKGLGVSELLYQLGVIRERTDYFPFWIPQLVAGLAVGWYLWRYQQRRREINPGIVLALWAAWLTSVWIFHRYFNYSHLAFLVTLIGLAYFYRQLWLSRRPKAEAMVQLQAR